jgi:hypothetical protein
MTKRSSDEFDLDNTDELPVLLEPVEDVAEPFAVARPEDTAEHTELFPAPGGGEGSERLLAELMQRAEQIPVLEAQIRVLTDGARALEQRLAEKDARVEELRAAAALSRESRQGQIASAAHLATELANRDAQIAQLGMTVERLEAAAAARSIELEQLREAAKMRASEADDLRRALEAKAAADPVPPGDDLREAYSTLQSYVAGRHAWWDEMQGTNARLTERATELAQELAAGAKRLAAAETFAAKESERAVRLRAELVNYARRVDALERELKLQRAPSDRDVPALPSAVDSRPALQVAAAPNSQPASTSADTAVAGDGPPLLTDTIDAVPASVETIAQLEAEVEYKRQQVAAQLVELRDREQQLQGALSELAALRAELDDSRADVARLERTISDKDRALEARDARIAALQDELKQRPSGVDKRGAGDFSLPATDSGGARRAPPLDAENTQAPALICLTGDAPKQFALTQKTVTVGRGPHCDLQIVTHFVSREHARLTVSDGATLIEDLGSRNGVFVNSVRVDRRHLQQGDLVTIGETQFRFVESVAH